eukprot:m.29425 g.29425  ORF g.29425 m.29425 type:complete len:203 (+) comp9574_c0_seq1:292-900(+)
MSGEKQPLYPSVDAPSYQRDSMNQHTINSSSAYNHNVGSDHVVEVTASNEGGDRWNKYLGPVSEVEEVFNAGMKPVHVDFASTFPQLQTKDDLRVIELVRKFNGIVYEFCADAIDVVGSILFGVVASIFVGLMMGLTRTFYTYMMGPFIKWLNIFVSIMAPSWRAFFRAMFDPFFESASLALSNIQVRMGMEANARHKAIKP